MYWRHPRGWSMCWDKLKIGIPRHTLPGLEAEKFRDPRLTPHTKFLLSEMLPGFPQAGQSTVNNFVEYKPSQRTLQFNKGNVRLAVMVCVVCTYFTFYLIHSSTQAFPSPQKPPYRSSDPGFQIGHGTLSSHTRRLPGSLDLGSYLQLPCMP
jgi:hypothetical protein